VSGEAIVADEHHHRGQQVVVAGVAEEFEDDLAFAEFGIGQTPRHRHAVGGGDQIQLQTPVPAGVAGAVAVVGPASQVAALSGGPGGAAGHRRRVDEPERVRVDRDLRGQRVQGLVQQRPLIRLLGPNVRRPDGTSPASTSTNTDETTLASTQQPPR
jgi:hypothetical protein